MTNKKTIRVLRAERAMKARDAAKAVGVHPTTWSEYENGKMMPSGPVLQRIASLFKVDACDIDLSPRVAA